MDIRQIIKEKRDIFKAMDQAIDKTLNVQDAQMRQYLFLSVMRMNLNMIVLKIQSMPKKQ